MLVILTLVIFFFFFFNDTATTEIYTLSLHDALPIFLFFGQRQVLVVLFENVSDALLFCRRVKGPPRDIVDIDGLFIKLPGHQITVAQAVQPGPSPGHEAVRDNLAGKSRIFRVEKLHFVECQPVAQSPGRQHDQAPDDHRRRGQKPASELRKPKKQYAKHDRRGEEQQGGFRAKQRAHTRDESRAERRVLHAPARWHLGPPQEKIRLLHCFDCHHKNAARERGPKTSENFGEGYGRVIRGKGANRGQPQRQGVGPLTARVDRKSVV